MLGAFRTYVLWVQSNKNGAGIDGVVGGKEEEEEEKRQETEVATIATWRLEDLCGLS